MIDLGTGNNNKINWALTDKQELIDIIETVYRSAVLHTRAANSANSATSELLGSITFALASCCFYHGFCVAAGVQGRAVVLWYLRRTTRPSIATRKPLLYAGVAQDVLFLLTCPSDFAALKTPFHGTCSTRADSPSVRDPKTSLLVRTSAVGTMYY